jgi:hypothetical protein
MAIIEIKDFRQGLNTFDDPEDSGQLSEYKNFNIRKSGILETRKALRPEYKSTTSVAIYDLWRWTNSNESVWIVTDKFATGDDVLLWNINNTFTSVADFNSDIIRAIINREAFRAILADTKVKIIQYIDNEYFFGGYDPAAGYIAGNAALEYPSTWKYNYVKTTAGTGAMAIGHHYYKAVPVFDGVQEALFGESHAYLKTTQADKAFEIRLDIDTNNFNKRITSINLYRAFSTSINVEPSYYFVKAIPLKTKITHSDRADLDAANVGQIVYIPGEDFTQSEYSSYTHFFFGWTGGSGEYATTPGVTTPYQIASKHNEYLVLTPLSGTAIVEGIDNSAWDRPWTITDSTNSSPSSSGSKNRAYAGRDVIVDPDGDYSSNKYTNWVAYDSSSNNAIIEQNNAKAFRLNQDFGSYSANVDIDISDGYRYEISSNNVYIYMYDKGYLDGAPHHLDGVKSAKVNYKYGAELNGRLFVGNVITDPDDTAEVYNNWVMYSEMNQPDVIPLDNFISIDDPQGGEITGVINFNGDLVVFSERGIFRLDVPSLDPSGWSLSETSPNIGCIAPESIVQHNGIAYFMSKKNIYALMPNFNVMPIGNNILDVIESEAIARLALSKFEIDYKNETLLCRIGNDANEYIYNMHIPTFQFGERTIWGKHVYSDDSNLLLASGLNNIVNDENLETYILTNDYENSLTKSSKLIKIHDANGNEGRHFVYKTNHIQINKASKTSKVRKINVTHKGIHSSIDAKLKVYVDKSSSVFKTFDFPDDDNETDGQITTFRIGCRAKFIQFEISSGSASSRDVEISKIEVEYE